MKKQILILFMVGFISFPIFSQSSLKVYSKLKEKTSWVKVYLNGKPYDANFWDEVIIEDLKPGKYKMVVSFNSDTISDYVKMIKIPRKTKIIYKVVKKGNFGKEAGKMGRSFGRIFKQTKKDEKEGLIQYYRLEEKTKKKKSKIF